MSADLIALSQSVKEIEISIPASAEEEKAKVISLARTVTAVNSPATQELARQAVAEIKGLIKKLEAARVATKKPFDDKGAEIQAIAKKFKAEPDLEVARLEALLVAYQRELDAEAARVRREAEEKLRQEREAAEAEKRAEAEKLAALAEKAKTPEIKQALQQQAAEAGVAASQAAAAPVVVHIESPKLAGAGVSRPWSFRVTDIAALVKARPDLCRIEPNASAINAAIRGDNGIREIPGLEIFQETKVAVRAAA